MNAGGLPQWPAKSLVVIGFFLLAVQGISEIIKRIAIMRGLIEDHTHTASDGGHAAAALAEAERLLKQAQADGLAPIAAAEPAPGAVTVRRGDTLGNIARNPNVGLLFLRFDGQSRRLRISGRASLHGDVVRVACLETIAEGKGGREGGGALSIRSR
jgi:hypothetical protein